MTKNKPKIEQMSEQELIFTLLSEKVGAVNPKDIFYSKRIDAGKNAGKFSCTIAGKKISAVQSKNLQAEALTLDKMQLWKLFTETLVHEAQLRMFKLSKTERDLDWGKAILHSVSVMETILKAVKNVNIEETV